MHESILLIAIIVIVFCFSGAFACAMGLIAYEVKDKREKTTAKKFSSAHSPWDEQPDFTVDEYFDYSEVIEQRQRL